jgi:hypothetical protein
MRPSQFQIVVALLLAAAAARSPVFAGGPKAKPVPVPVRHVAPPQPVPPKVIESWEEKGYGDSVRDARKAALDKLYEDLSLWLDTNRADLTVKPLMAYVESKMVREVGEPVAQELPVSGRKEVVTLKLELTEPDVAYLVKLTAAQVAQQRQGLLARGLAGAVGVLVLATGYLRLEEKVGRQKRKLGLVAVALIGLAGLTLLALI